MIKLRNMTSIFILDSDRVLLLYRVGSRVITSPTWCGIGGHFEAAELNDPCACVLRELHEETGLGADDIRDLRLKYVTLSKKGDEIRQNYYFFANLANRDFAINECDEGRLEWIDIDKALTLELPFSAGYCFRHYFDGGRDDDCVYAGIASGGVCVIKKLEGD